MMANVADANRELADFLKRARSAVDPARAGLPADGRIRRVPGLRREEVALLAGVSTDYYTRLEQGRRITPSAAVLDAIARALDLGDTGRSHLGRLVGASPTRRRSSRPVQRVRPGLYQLLDSLDETPAMILGRRTDVLATNRAARVLFADFDAMPPRERNYARWMFTSEQARNLFADWSVQARTAVENLRLDFGGDPHDPAVIELVDELSAASAEFRMWWAEHRVFQRTYGTKRLRHPVVGDLSVDYETFTMPGDAEQTLFVYLAEAGSPSRDALNLLLSWSANSV
ncbi:helix-turn-helix transcriptional regulator [Mycolicibacterium austroafricanum]|uniref:helix-turn-helix domain-containing protein n=1 Tax=Mycolicibacterium TaxID=1866885 RepID=UPI000CF8DA32|nr:helix-turn-helix transcriptional regulator [Mycolicibacterium austroafricanum]PQP51640.1 transcriptional regulator [Mycolicibacterium austroafricanum]QRZ06540.1 helix-turn-helix domain-containing protein [Mycolicibacterium austroafricanum]QZT68024.1 helix-turn-helix transcriptional regulator [Mycolicibacterium austroafricanum]